MQQHGVSLGSHDFYVYRKKSKHRVKKHRMESIWRHFDIIKESIKASKKDIWISLGVFVVAMLFVVLYIKLYIIIQALA